MCGGRKNNSTHNFQYLYAAASLGLLQNALLVQLLLWNVLLLIEFLLWTEVWEVDVWEIDIWDIHVWEGDVWDIYFWKVNVWDVYVWEVDLIRELWDVDLYVSLLFSQGRRRRRSCIRICLTTSGNIIKLKLTTSDELNSSSEHVQTNGNIHITRTKAGP